MKRIIFLVGATASGKDYTKKKLQTFVNVPSVTTRKQREGEIPNKDYFFISNEEFDELIKNGELCEHIKVGEANYGIKKQVLIDHIREFDNIIIIVEPNGLIQILNYLIKYLKYMTEFDDYEFTFDIVYFSFGRVTRFLNLVFEEFKNELNSIGAVNKISFEYLKELDDKKSLAASLKEDEKNSLEKMEKILNRLVRNGDNIEDLWNQNFDTIRDLILSLKDQHYTVLRILKTKEQVAEYIEQVNDSIKLEKILNSLYDLKSDQLYKIRDEIKLELNRRGK